LIRHASAHAFEVIALDPNPPDCADDVTHPHVRNGELCAGDATVPISQALESGRLADAFLAIRAVLETYNESSPYVALSEWNGRPCDDCGASVDSDDAYSCEECNQLCCGECISRYEICDSSFCQRCLAEDPQSGRMCCRSCRHRCGQCSRIVDAESFVDETGLCPECHEEHIQPQENDHEESHPDQPLPANPAAVPATAGGPLPDAA